MFMVAASVVTTILVLNYHHRHADTHEMPEWVFILILLLDQPTILQYHHSPGPRNISPVDPMVPQNVSAGREDHQEDNHDAEEDEGNGAEGDLLQVAAGQRSRHRRQLPVCGAGWEPLQPPQPCRSASSQRLFRGEVSMGPLPALPAQLSSVIFPAHHPVSSQTLRLFLIILYTGSSASSSRRSRSSLTRSGTTRSPGRWRVTGSLLPWCWTGCVWWPTPPSPSWPRWPCSAQLPMSLSRLGFHLC